MPRTATALALALTACVAPVGPPAPSDDLGALPSSLSAAQRRARAAQIRDAAARAGLEQGWLLAGIADAETTMAHCHSELTWACRGPYSADCGGPVVAGAGDGPCSARQGGLGMFQFDAGTYEDTLAREGTRIFSIAGNVEAAVDFAVNMVIRSAYVPGVSDRAGAIAWMNGVRIGNGRWDAWIRTVTHYYNGCAPSYSCFPSRYARYRDHTTGVYHEMGADFWNVSRCEPACVSASRIRGADCGVGDCAVFGATCVDDALGARCVSVFCPARGRDHACLPDGDTLITCNDGGIEGRGQCSAFGATCVDDELGARCVSVFCPARGRDHACLPNGTRITCRDGGIADSQDCAAEGGSCVDDELGARCVSDLCEPVGTVDRCASGDILVSCADGAITGTVDCTDEGGQCVEDALGVRCVVCPEGEASSRCVDEQFLEVCSGGRPTVTECTGGEVCREIGGLARCTAPDAEPIDPPGPSDPEPGDPGAPRPSSLRGGCAVGGAGHPPPPLFAIVLALALAARRRR